jgi:hypothetical protein
MGSHAMKVHRPGVEGVMTVKVVLAVAILVSACAQNRSLPKGLMDAASDRGIDVANDTSGSNCLSVPAPRALIADFNDLAGDSFGFHGVDSVFGNTFVNPPLLRQDFSGGNWHVTGTVARDLGFFGLYWNCLSPSLAGAGNPPPIHSCALDVSQYVGIQFTIKGDAGPDAALDFAVGIVEDVRPVLSGACGTCGVPDDASAEAACHAPRLAIDVSGSVSAANTVTLFWSDFAGGSPRSSIDPQQLTGMRWSFHSPPASDGGATSYPADITIDDIRFITDTR